MNKPNSHFSSNAAGAVTKIGFLGAKFTASLLIKGVSSGVKAAVDTIKGPQDFITVCDTKLSASRVLFQILSWGASKKYISAYDFSERMNILTLGGMVRNDLLPKIPHHSCILKLDTNQEVNDFWEKVLKQQMIPYIFE